MITKFGILSQINTGLQNICLTQTVFYERHISVRASIGSLKLFYKRSYSKRIVRWSYQHLKKWCVLPISPVQFVIDPHLRHISVLNGIISGTRKKKRQIKS